jgi:hypothetical protein
MGPIGSGLFGMREVACSFAVKEKRLADCGGYSLVQEGLGDQIGWLWSFSTQ